MGKRNRQRRPRTTDAAAAVEMDVLAAAGALRRGDAAAAIHLDRLGIGDAGPCSPGFTTMVAQVVERLVERSIEAAWERGWQPADLARAVRRRWSAGHVAALAAAIASQHRRYGAATVDRAWREQLRAIGADPWRPPEPGSAGAHLPLDGRSRHCDEADTRLLLEVLSVLAWLPTLPRLGPLPGEGHTSNGMADAAVDARVLERVRALLAKAESTTFAEEADSFTAKAQQLMARHSVDRAMVDGTGAESGPRGRRIGVDDPYARAKSLLLGEVAAANRCRAVWTSGLGFSTVFGHEIDLDGVELIYTSLLVQAVAAMTLTGAHVDRHGRSSTRSFRSAFLVAYAGRIGQRLRANAGAAETAAAAEHGADLLPVLADRHQAVEDAVGATFPRLRSQWISVTNGAGWAAGTAAAELATLAPFEAMEQGVAGGAGGPRQNAAASGQAVAGSESRPSVSGLLRRRRPGRPPSGRRPAPPARSAPER